MEKALGLISTETSVARKAVPRLRLLLELEPARKVFFRNLWDAITRREPPPIKLTSPPGVFWHDVFVSSELPWKSFQESIAWHCVAIGVAWALMQLWVSRPQPHVNQASYRASRALYYTPPKSDPLGRNDVPRTQRSRRMATTSGRAQPMTVAAERRGTAPKLVVPPDLKLAVGNRAPNLSGPATMPSVPLSATARTAQAPLGGLGAVVAPPPEIGGRANRLGGLAQAAVVAPPVDASGMGSRRTLRGPSGNVIEPPPQLAAQGLGSGSGARSLGGVAGAVVPPPPSVEHSGRAGTVSGPGVAVVPPPPSMKGAGIGGGGSRGPVSGGVGSQVVPPPPSVQGGGSVLAALSSFFSGGSSKIVPPPPGVQGVGAGSSGSGMSSLGGGGSAVVPPPPSVQGGGSGQGRITSLATGGSEIVPPPPSVQGAGGTSARGGFGGPLAGGGSHVVPPSPGLSGMGSGSGMGTGNRGMGLSAKGSDVVPPPPSVAGGTGTGGGLGGRVNSLGAGGEVVPPPPNVQGTGTGMGSGNGTGGRGGPQLAGGSNVVGPPPSTAGVGGGGGNARAGGLAGGGMTGSPPPLGAGSVSTGPLEQMDPLPDVPQTAQSPQSLPESALPPGEDVPLRLIPVPGASTRTSFFSNYEVVLAERNITQTQKELIKLVYVSLPYQKRLAEYDWSTARIYKLRVIQDPKCDESLMEMMMPEGGGPIDPETEASANRLASEVTDKNMKLHCYRTTADDFARAMSRH